MKVAREVVRLSVLMAVICLLVCNAIRIRGSNSIIYEPSNPSHHRLTCEDDLGQKINDPTWTRDNGDIEASFIENGRLILGERTIGTDNPQSFEDRYRCHSNGDRSDELSFYVLPNRLQHATPIVSRQLEEINVTIACHLRFGNLRDGWSVQWTVQDSQSQSNRLSSSGYIIQSNPNFQLVIKKASIDYDGARFQCQAIRGDALVDSHFVTLNLFHEPEITSGPSDPVVVNLAHGIVDYEIKVYPRPSIRFCYNDTCIGAGRHDRIQITNHQNNGTSHTAQFTINSMTEVDNGNVTLELNHTEMNFVKNYTVMLFLPYKIWLAKNGNIANKQVPLLITLRRPLHFQYQIEFVDMEHNPLGTMEGMKGQTSFTHMLRVERNTDVMARFMIGEVSGPNSDPVTVDVENPGDVPVSNSSGSNSVSVIIGGVMGGVILLLMITVVFFIVLLFVERSHRREPSHVYEQVFYNRTKLSTDVKIKHDAAYNATEDVTVDSLYSTFNEVPYTTDSSYAVPAMACSKTSEDEHYDTVQANERSDVEETVVKMDTNPSYGVSTGEDRATATDYDTKAHQSSQEYDYDDVHDDPAQLYYNMATTTTADVEEDIVQHKCTLDQRHDTKTTLVANSAKLTDEDKYGDINQPRCDDNSFDTTVDHNATTKSCLPLIMSGAKPAGEGKYGVINQPRCDDNSFDSTVDHNATTKSCIMSGAKPAGEGKYGVINQPRCDDFSFNTTVDQSLTAKSSPLPYLPLPANDTRSIDKDEYGVINQPQCDDLI